MNIKLFKPHTTQRECIDKDIDWYLGICPDIYFSEYTLPFLIECTKNINNK